MRGKAAARPLRSPLLAGWGMHALQRPVIGHPSSRKPHRRAPPPPPPPSRAAHLRAIGRHPLAAQLATNPPALPRGAYALLLHTALLCRPSPAAGSGQRWRTRSSPHCCPMGRARPASTAPARRQVAPPATPHPASSLTRAKARGGNCPARRQPHGRPPGCHPADRRPAAESSGEEAPLRRDYSFGAGSLDEIDRSEDEYYDGYFEDEEAGAAAGCWLCGCSAGADEEEAGAAAGC